MADVFSPEKRSEVMSRIRGRDTKPELTLRSMLHRLGYRFTVNGANNQSLPGKPDLVLPKYQTVIFVHGCFWHGHAHCKHFRLPKSRSEWWQAKIEGNQARDLRTENAIRTLGWHVVTIWECALKTAAARAWLTHRLPGLLGPPPPVTEPAPLPMVAEDETPYRTAPARP
ncbi:MAG: very short patch repair endonuclease [Akkermansiaceae bacterium]|nr:very short patch repair endonuclease [Akkermansiaceae bacterium]